MEDKKLQLIIEASDKTRAAFAELDQHLQDVQKGVQKTSGVLQTMKSHWIALSAAAVSIGIAFSKAMQYIDLGAAAIRSEEAFRAMADAGEVNIARLREGMKKAADGMIDDSDLMQRAAFMMAQDIDPEKIPRLLEAARIAARKTGKDVSEAVDGMVQAIATNMPRSLRQMGAITKEQMNLLSKAAAEGATEIGLLDLVLANSAVDQAKFGNSADNAGKQIRRLKTDVKELKELLGKELLFVAEKVIGAFYGLAASATYITAGYHKMRVSILESSIASMEKMKDRLGPLGLKDLENQKGMLQQQRAFAQAATEEADKFAKKSLDNMWGPETETGGDTRTQDQKQKEIAAAEAARASEEAKIRAAGSASSFREIQRALVQAEIQTIRSGLEETKEVYKLQEVEAEKRYKTGLDSETVFIEEKQRLEKASLTATLAALDEEKAAVQSRYAAMIGGVPAGKESDKEKLAAERKKETARIDGEIAKTRIDLQIVEKKNDIDAIERQKALGGATREGELKNLETAITLETELNKLRVERGDMTVGEATEKELANERALLTLKRDNLATDREAATDDAKKISLDAELAIIQNQLDASDTLRIKIEDGWRQTRQNAIERREQALQAELEAAKLAENYAEQYRLEADLARLEGERLLLQKGLTAEQQDAVKKLSTEKIRQAEVVKPAQYDRSVREAEINSRLAALDLNEAEGTVHRETLEERIRLTQELIDVQQKSLEAMPKTGNEEAWNVQMDKVTAARKAFANLTREIALADPFKAISLSLKDFANEAANVGQSLYESIKKAFDGMTEALTEFVMTGKLNFSDLANSIIRDMIRIMTQAQITGPLAKAVGGINWSGLLGMFGSSAGAGENIGGGGVNANIGHTGGMGNELTFYRIVPSALFAGAPRYHAGIGPGERAAIIRDDEGVFTPGQMKALAPAAGPQSIRIEVLDKSGAKVSASKPEVRFDAQEMVVSFFIDALQNNKYGLRTMMGR